MTSARSMGWTPSTGCTSCWVHDMTFDPAMYLSISGLWTGVKETRQGWATC